MTHPTPLTQTTSSKRRADVAQRLGTFIALGGTGVIGQALEQVLRSERTNYLSVSLSEDRVVDGFQNIRFDLENGDPDNLQTALRVATSEARVVGILDLLGVEERYADVIRQIAMDDGCAIGVMSSCLLYDHDGSAPVDETCRSFTTSTARYGYQCKKAALEMGWQHAAFEDWVMLRANHILGRGSLLGCIPDHNRDPRLLERLAGAEPLALVSAGQINVSYAHPIDLASAAVALLTERHCLGRIVNLAHPVPVRAVDYYREICHQLRCPMPQISTAEIDPTNFWASTAQDNVFSTHWPESRALTFGHDIRACIRDALTVGEFRYRQMGAFLRQRLYDAD